MAFLTPLQDASYILALVTAGITGGRWVLKTRRESINALRTDLVRSWTNEGDVASRDSVFVTIDLDLKYGDVCGALSSSQLNRPLSVNVDVRWGHAVFHITTLAGITPLKVARIKARLRGNRNRLHWKVLKQFDRSIGLPQRTVMWPSPVGADAWLALSRAPPQ